MTDQIFDKKSVGIPEDFVFVRAEIEQMRDETRLDSLSAAASAAQAKQHASDARDCADESRKWAEVRHLGVHFSDHPPEEVVDGMTWLETDEEAEQVVAIKRYGSTSTRNCVFPSEDTYPSDALLPRQVGEWQEFKLAPGVLA